MTLRTPALLASALLLSLCALFAPLAGFAQETLPPVGGCFCNSTGSDPNVNVAQCVENLEACNLLCCEDSATSCAACECVQTCSIGGQQDDSVSGKAGAKAKTYKLENPLRYNTVEGAIGGGIKIFVGISGSIALLMFTYGGVMMLISGGRAERVDAGRKAIVWASVGLAVIFLSYLVLRLIFTSLGAGL